MKFSIVVPVYNVERYLRECIDSIVNQKYKDYELILVDNGSTDSSGEICDEYAEKYPNVKTKHLMPNIGASGARNEGQMLATGDYMLFVDSDDYYLNDQVLSKINVVADAANNPDVILYKTVNYFEETKTLKPCRYALDVTTTGKSVSEIYCELVEKDAYSNSTWSKAIRRNLLEENNIRFTPGLIVEDNDWYYNVVLHLKSMALIDEPFYVYRRRTTGSVTATATMKNTTDCLWVIDKWLGVINEHPENANTEIIKRSLAKQYCNYLIGFSKLQFDKNVYADFKRLEFLLKCSNNPRVRTFRMIKNVISLKGLIYTLKIVQKYR